nr:SDR family NAD(P)-dependent oxidoreductase [Frankia sp. Mgl5]
MPFEGTTTIVTGGASGLGLAITEALVARGTKVAVFDIQTELLDTEVKRLQRQGGAVRGYAVDVSDRGPRSPPPSTRSARTWDPC